MSPAPKLHNRFTFSGMLLHACQMDAWLLFLFLYLHASFTSRGSVFSVVKEKQVLLLADVQSQLCEWVKLQQSCRLVSTACCRLSFI
jgi:hypothetical protein